jgi:cellulose synthase/poly-beta-1,6-N-acetylglucosamine synthase-like glycosyltransferase
VDARQSEPEERDAGPRADSISACLVAYHEEAVVERCLASLADLVDEIIVIHDGPCADRTLAIAELFGARTAELSRVGHAEQHTVTALEWAASEWILSIDADEFLSDELRRALPELARREDVNGFEFLWRMWDGERYFTTNGPHKLSLFRRRAVHLVGHIHNAEEVDPPIERTNLQLHHQPLYNNFTLPVMLRKWRRWARIHAQESLMPLERLPQFNVDPPRRWTARRHALNALSPLLVLPYVVASFAVNVWAGREVYTPREGARMAMYSAFYAGMVQLYIAKLLYVDPPRGRRPSPAGSLSCPPTR